MMPEKESQLLGEIAFGQGYGTMAQIEECLLMRSLGETEAELDEILLFQGYLTPAQQAHFSSLSIFDWTCSRAVAG